MNPSPPPLACPGFFIEKNTTDPRVRVIQLKFLGVRKSLAGLIGIFSSGTDNTYALP